MAFRRLTHFIPWALYLGLFVLLLFAGSCAGLSVPVVPPPVEKPDPLVRCETDAEFLTKNCKRDCSDEFRNRFFDNGESYNACIRDLITSFKIYSEQQEEIIDSYNQNLEAEYGE